MGTCFLSKWHNPVTAAYELPPSERNMKWGDITLNIDCVGNEYIEKGVERQTKTRLGDYVMNTQTYQKININTSMDEHQATKGQDVCC